MTSPIATALTGLLGGYNAGMEQRRARERQAMLDQQGAETSRLQHAISAMNLSNMESAAAQRERDLTELPQLARRAIGGDREAALEYARRVPGSDTTITGILAPRQQQPEKQELNGKLFERQSDGTWKEVAANAKAEPTFEERQENGGVAVYENGHFLKWKIEPPSVRNQGMAEQRTFQREQGLQQDYASNPVVKDAYGIANAVGGIKSAATGKTPQNDLAMIYSLVKYLDPSSAVREGEIDLARAARSLGTQITGAWKKVKSGNLLTDQERQNILGMLDERVRSTRARLAPIQKDFGQRARQFGADSAYVAPDPFRGIDGGGPTQQQLWGLKPLGGK